jgi:hypothetical protein
MHSGYIDILPSEIRNNIFNLLKYRSFYNLRLTCKTYSDIKVRQAWNDCLIKTEKWETIRDVALFYDDDILLKQTLNILANETPLSLNSHLIFGLCKKCISLFYNKNFSNKLSITEDFPQYILHNAINKGNSDLFRLCVYRVAKSDPSEANFYSFLEDSKKHPKFLKILLKTKEFDNFWVSQHNFGGIVGLKTPLFYFLHSSCFTHVKLILKYKKELCQNPMDALNIFSKIVFSNNRSALPCIKTIFQICDVKDLIQKCDKDTIELLVSCICHNEDKEFMERLINDDIFKCITWHPHPFRDIIFNDVYRMFIMNVLNL